MHSVCTFYEKFNRSAGLLALIVLLLGVGTAARASNPTVMQGSSSNFPSTGTDPCGTSGATWDLVLNSQVIASSTTPNGWSVSLSGSTFNVGAPASATIATNYEIRYGQNAVQSPTSSPSGPSTGASSAFFDVIASIGTITLTGFTISPTSVSGGGQATGTLTLSANAPSNGLVVNINCSPTSAAVLQAGTAQTAFPTTVTIPAGFNSTQFTIQTSTVNYATTATFSATYNGTNINASLQINPTHLRVTHYIMPQALVLVWDGSAVGSFVLKRSVMSGTPPAPTGTVTIATLSNTTFTDTDSYAFANGTTYLYQLFDSNSPATPLASEEVQPYLSSATDNQAVDSRLDLRYSTTTYLNFNFGNTAYRGGLFAGFIPTPDNSQVGRSFGKFSVTAPPAGGWLRSGDIDAYFTGATNGTANSTVSVNVGCQAIANNTWSGSTLTWSTAPTDGSYNPANANAVATVTYNPSSFTPSWADWSLPNDILTAAQGNGTLSVAWASTSETTAGWAYFAKTAYDPTLAPQVGYVWALPVPIQLILTPTVVHNVGTLQAQVIMNGLGLGGSPVTLTISTGATGSASASAPSTATVTGVTTTAFTVGVSAPYPSGGGIVTVQVSCNGVTVSAQATVLGS